MTKLVRTGRKDERVVLGVKRGAIEVHSCEIRVREKGKQGFAYAPEANERFDRESRDISTITSSGRNAGAGSRRDMPLFRRNSVMVRPFLRWFAIFILRRKRVL